MKQHITIKQLNKLSAKGKERLREWWNPKEGDFYLRCDIEEDTYEEHLYTYEEEPYEYDPISAINDYPILSIGQMIEFLDEQDKNQLTWVMFAVCSIYDWEEGAGIESVDITDICNILWQAVKEVLENEKD